MTAWSVPAFVLEITPLSSRMRFGWRIVAPASANPYVNLCLCILETVAQSDKAAVLYTG